jgi:hypothetical protein
LFIDELALSDHGYALSNRKNKQTNTVADTDDTTRDFRSDGHLQSNTSEDSTDWYDIIANAYVAIGNSEILFMLHFNINVMAVGGSWHVQPSQLAR